MLMCTRMIEYRHYDTLKVNGCCTNITDQSTKVSYITMSVNERVCDSQFLLFIERLCLYMCDNVHTLTNSSDIVKRDFIFLFGSFPALKCKPMVYLSVTILLCMVCKVASSSNLLIMCRVSLNRGITMSEKQERFEIVSS